jgi:hypothetical protein
MRKTDLVVGAAAVAALFSFLGPRTLAFGDHGTELYTPDRIEWAALQLQAVAGQHTMTAPLLVTFAPDSEKSTIRCVLYHSPDYDASAVLESKQSIQRAFDAYRQSPGGWGWLKLKIVETTKDHWPQG